MQHIGFYCRGGCNAETLHAIQGFNTDGPSKNVAKLKCIKCSEPAFVVEYPKEATAPTSGSKRVERFLVDDEQQSYS